MYLHDVLPSCSPKCTITIQAPLTQTGDGYVHLENAGDNVIQYKAIFFNNQNNLFQVTNYNIEVPPNGKRTVKIRYHAKFVKNAEAYLLFSGETPGNKYGKSVAVTLVGVADVSYVSMEIPLTLKLYKPCQVTINAASPFKVEADYSLCIKENTFLFPWEEIKNLRTVKDFVLEDEMCKFDENGLCTTKPLVCCFSTQPQNVRFCFTNPDVGDWAVQLTFTGKVTETNYEYLTVIIPKSYHSLPCRCKTNIEVTKNCPKVLYVQVPSQNNLLWDARKSMMLQYVQDEEKEFWKTRIYSVTGTRILSLMLNSETHPLKQPVIEKVTYTIQTLKNCPFVTLQTLTIDDVTSEDFVELPVHPVKSPLMLTRTSLILVSEDGKEKRFYKLFFKSDSVEQARVSLPSTFAKHLPKL